jgi:integrase
MAQVRPRGKNTWGISVYLGRDEHTGKRRFHNETFHGSKREADQKGRDLETEHNNGTLTIGSQSLLISTLIDDVIRDYRIKDQDVGTCLTRANRIKPVFGSLTPSKLKRDHIKAYIDKLKSQGTPNATINRDIALLRHALNLAVEDGKLAAVPFRIKDLPENNARKGFLEDHQYRALLTHLPAFLRPLLVFAYYTGMRPGEILTIRWEQVDLIAGEIRLEMGETKNKEGRIVPLHMSDELFQTISMQRSIRDVKYPSCPWVFFNEFGTDRIKDYERSWDIARTAAGYPDLLLYDNRRTGVRNMVRAGVHETVAMKISGHKTRSVFDRYNVTDTRDIHEAARKVAEYTRARRQAAEGIPAQAQGAPDGSSDKDLGAIQTKTSTN